MAAIQAHRRAQRPPAYAGKAITLPSSLYSLGNGSAMLAAGASFTLETWFYTIAYTNPPTGVGPHGPYNNSADAQMIFDGPCQFYTNATQIVMNNYGYTSGYSMVTSNPVGIGAWNHIALGFDATVGQYKVWVNGALYYTSPTGKPGNGGCNGVYIGGYSNVQYYASYGYQDEPRVWPYLRTDAQILANYNKPNSLLTDLSTAAGAWSFDETPNPSPAQYPDGSGHGRVLQTTSNAIESAQVASTVPFA